MEVSNLFIIRALPGAGKSTVASLLAREDAICTTDDYPGLYTYLDSGKVIFHGGEKEGGLPMIVTAHAENQKRAAELMAVGEASVVIPNTNTQRWEFQPYLDLATEFGYRVTVISLFDGGATDQELSDRNTHGVPLDAIAAMRERFEHDWKTADSRAPWERS
jgi:predicted kinase